MHIARHTAMNGTHHNTSKTFSPGSLSMRKALFSSVSPSPILQCPLLPVNQWVLRPTVTGMMRNAAFSG